MAEHLLDAAQVGAALEQVGGEGVTEQVRMDATRLQPGDLGQAAQDQEGAGPGQPAAAGIEEELGTGTALEEGSPARQIAGQGIGGPAPDRHDPLLVALAQAANDPVVEIEAGPLWQLDFRPMIEQIARETAEGAPQPSISAKFHNTLADAIVETCRRIRGETKLTRVCLSGGTFQNMRLLALAVAGLSGAGFEVFLHAKVPPNDGGIALGQAAIAAELMR